MKKETFSERLITTMKAEGHLSRRKNSNYGVNVRLLANKAGVSYEVARRWLKGPLEPGLGEAGNIAVWLKVSLDWLMLGKVGPKINPKRFLSVYQTCTEAVELKGGIITDEQFSALVAYVYNDEVEREDSVIHIQGLLNMFS